MTTKTTARAIGILILAGWFTYGPGNGLTTSILSAADSFADVAANQLTIRLGAVLMLLNSVAVVGIGVLWFPVLQRFSQRVAVSYLSTRILEAALCAVGVISLLALTGISDGSLGSGTVGGAPFEVPGALAIQANDVAYQIGMAALGAGSLAFCSLLYRTGLIPSALAVWGFAGYAIFLAGMVLELLGVEVGLLLSAPGGAFELVFAIWLIAKGFAPSATAGDPAAAVSQR